MAMSLSDFVNQNKGTKDDEYALAAVAILKHNDIETLDELVGPCVLLNELLCMRDRLNVK